jgi:hypothetical protein
MQLRVYFVRQPGTQLPARGGKGVKIVRSFCVILFSLASLSPAQTVSSTVQQDMQKLDADNIARRTGMSPQQAMELVQKAVRIDAEVFVAAQYCRGVEAFAGARQPLLFAAGAVSNNELAQWRQFDSRGEWEEASRPMPAALVWLRDGRVVLARLTVPRNGKTSAMATYCFRENGTLARLTVSSQPSVQSVASGLRAEITLCRNWFYLPDGNKVVERTLEFDPRPLKSEKTTYIYLTAPQFRTVFDLPFARLLYPPV